MTTRLLCLLATRDEAAAYARRKYFGEEIETAAPQPLEHVHERLDELERRILELPPVHMPVEHAFTPGLYRRTITMPPGTLLTSRIHRTEHPYAVMRGRAMVLVAGEEPVLLEAGHQGITKSMTRRALFIPPDAGEPCVWSTYHALSTDEERMRQNGATDEELLAAIEARIIEPHLQLDGSDHHALYRQALAAAGLPGPHDGPRALPKDEVYELPHGEGSVRIRLRSPRTREEGDVD